jgi:hypothetical protein
MLCSISTTRHICVLDEWSLCSSFSLLLSAFAALAAKRYCLESKITAACVRPDSLISAPLGVVCSTLRMDLACRMTKTWRSSCLPVRLAYHKSSLPYSGTALTQATWPALTLSGTTLYVFVRVRRLTSAAWACFMHRLWCSLNVWWASIQKPSKRVACVLNHMNPFPTFIVDVSFGRRCSWWHCLGVHSAAFVCAVWNRSPCLLARSMLFAVHLSSILTI